MSRRKRQPEERLNISNNVGIIEIKKSDLPDRQDQADRLRFVFEYKSKYEPNSQ